MDKKMRNLIIIGLCLMATILGIWYQAMHLKDGKTVMEYLAGESYEKTN